MNFKKYIFILIDGANFDVFKKLMDEGMLPNIKKYIAERGTFKKAVSVFPSTTGPAYIPFYMGLFPGTANLPGIRWFSKAKYTNYAFRSPKICSYMGLDGSNFNKDIVSYESIFDYFKSANVYNHINKGVLKTGNLTRKTKLLDYFYAYFTHDWTYVDKRATKFLLEAVDKDYDFITCLYPGVDEYSHLSSINSEAVIKEYINIDKHIGLLCKKLIQKNIFDETLIIISSDHGMSNTVTHIDFEKELDKLGYKTLHFPLVFRRDCKSACMVSGNGMLNLYFKKNNESWGSRVTYEWFSEKGLIGDILSIEGVDILACQNEEGDIIVASSDNIAKISFKDGFIFYDYEGENDPLQYKKRFNNLSFREALIKTYDTKYPDALVQLLQIFKSERTGDMVVCSRNGYDLRARFEINEHHATHGGLMKEHMLVPFISNCVIDASYIRTVDIYPTALALLGLMPKHKVDGVNLLNVK